MPCSTSLYCTFHHGPLSLTTIPAHILRLFILTPILYDTLLRQGRQNVDEDISGFLTFGDYVIGVAKVNDPVYIPPKDVFFLLFVVP
jgi:hypothetical protein